MEALLFSLSEIFIGFIATIFSLAMGIFAVTIILNAIHGKPSTGSGGDKDIVQALRECASDNPKKVWTRYWQTGKFETNPKRKRQFEQSVISSTGGMSGKMPNLINFYSAAVRKAERDMRYEDEHHDADDTKFTASGPAAGYDFGGHQIVDDFAELRRRNAEHEKHLEARIQGWG